MQSFQIQQGQAIGPITQQQFLQGEVLLQIPPEQFQQGQMLQFVIPMQNNLVKSQPTDLYQALCLPMNHPNFENIKQQMLTSTFKNTLENTELENMKDFSPGIDEMEKKFDATRLMICSIFGYTEKGEKLISVGANVDIQSKQGNTALVFASIFQREDFVEMLINKGANVNLKNGGQMDALMWATLWGNEEIVKILVDNKADVHARTQSGIDALHIAVEKGLDNIVQMLVDKDVNISSKSLDGWTPLMRSVRSQDSTITKLLLEKIVNVNERNSEGNTALHISAMYGNKSSISRLLKHGADVNCTNSLGMTPLMYAVNIEDNLKIVQQMLDKGAKEKINFENNFQRTALFYAILNNRKEVAKKLISSGANTEIYDVAGFSPIVYACKNKWNDLVKEWLKSKGDLWYKDEEFLICLHCCVENNDTLTTKCLLKFHQKPTILSELKPALKRSPLPALLVAANNKNTEMLKLLLCAGADVNSRNVFLRTALMISITLNETKTAKLLVETYNADVNLKDFKGDTALTLAAITNNKTMVDFLLKKNASRDHTNNQNVSAMMFASFGGKYGMVRSLYEEGYNLDLHDSNGWTPLMISLINGDIHTVRFLLDKGAHVNVFSNLRATPLTIASSHGRKELVALLLERGACINEKDINGQCPLIHAAMNGHKATTELLLKAGADVELQDCFGKTALTYTALKGDLESMKLLLQYNAQNTEGDISGNTPLIISTFNGFTNCVKELLDRKVAVNESNVDGNNALHFGASHGRNDAVSVLLQYNADPNLTNVSGITPLMMAAAKGDDAIVRTLLNCSVVDKDFRSPIVGRSALMIAALNNKLSTVKILVQAGANINDTNKEGNSVLNLSVVKGFGDIVNFLVTDPKIKVNTETGQGFTPLLLCIYFQRSDLIRPLVEAGADVKTITKLKVNAFSYSIARKSVSCLKEILLQCQLTKTEHSGYVEMAQKVGCEEILEVIQQATIYEDNKNIGSLNGTVESSVDGDLSSKCNPQGTLSSSALDALRGEVRGLPDTTTEQTINLQIDNANDKTLNFHFSGDRHVVTINNNINSDTMKNCMIGNENVLKDQSRQI